MEKKIGAFKYLSAGEYQDTKGQQQSNWQFPLLKLVYLVFVLSEIHAQDQTKALKNKQTNKQNRWVKNLKSFLGLKVKKRIVIRKHTISHKAWFQKHWKNKPDLSF